MNLEILNLSLENSPNSTLEFGEFSKLNSWVWRVLQTQKKNSFESEFGEFSKLSTWVWRILQTHFGFWKKNMFSGFCFFWIWVRGNLQTQPLSLENSPNSTSECVYFLSFDFFSKKMSLEILNLSLEIFSKLNPWVWRILQTQLLRFGEFSKLRKKIFWIWVWRILQTQIQKNFFLSSTLQFGEFCKLKCWVCRILQTQNQKKKFSDFFLKMHLEHSQEFL